MSFSCWLLANVPDFVCLTGFVCIYPGNEGSYVLEETNIRRSYSGRYYETLLLCSRAQFAYNC